MLSIHLGFGRFHQSDDGTSLLRIIFQIIIATFVGKLRQAGYRIGVFVIEVKLVKRRRGANPAVSEQRQRML